MKPSPLTFIVLSLILGSTAPAPAQMSAAAARPASERQSWRFDFGGSVPPQSTGVSPQTVFSDAAGFGFEESPALQTVVRGGPDRSRDGFVTSAQPFLFSIAVPEGVYRVTATFGDLQGESTTTVKAEARRLMIEKVVTAPGQFATCTFLVSVKRPELPGGRKVGLKPTEMGGHRDWDTRLTLEFSNTRPCLDSLEITPAKDFTTVYIAGDSTVTNQRSEPYAGWGQMLPRFFDDKVAVANHAHSGLALRSFTGSRRLDKILSTLRPGDYVLIQFGHNDQKDKASDAGPFTSYKANLREFVAFTRARGGLPVLITPMERRRFDRNGEQGRTLGDYAEAVRQVGAEEKVPVIDLNAMSLQLYAALGAEASKKAFVHFPANTFPGRPEALKDDTHHSTYGAYELARCVVEGLKATVPALAARLARDIPAFTPALPDPPEKVQVPASLISGVTEKPEGS